MLALASDHDVPVAVIGAVAVVLAAGIPSLMAFFASRKNRQTLGTKNGNGSVIDMLERLITKQDHHNALDTARFKRLYNHLDIPFDNEEEVTA